MSQEPQDKTTVEEPDEDTNVFVVDPEDYQVTRKLKAINDAKDHVRTLRQNTPNKQTKSEWRGMRKRIGEAVAMYGNELLPLIEDAIEQGVLEQEDLETNGGYGNVKTFIRNDGKRIDHDAKTSERPPPGYSMVFYRQLQRIERKLGLGLELQEDKGPAQI